MPFSDYLPYLQPALAVGGFFTNLIQVGSSLSLQSSEHEERTRDREQFVAERKAEKAKVKIQGHHEQGKRDGVNYIDLGVQAWKTGDFETAGHHYKQAITCWEKYTSELPKHEIYESQIDKENLAKMYFLSAFNSVLLEKYSESVRALESCIRYNKMDPKPKLLLGYVYYLIHDLTRARQKFTELTTRQPHTSYYFLALGFLNTLDNKLEDFQTQLKTSKNMPADLSDPIVSYIYCHLLYLYAQRLKEKVTAQDAIYYLSYILNFLAIKSETPSDEEKSGRRHYSFLERQIRLLRSEYMLQAATSVLSTPSPLDAVVQLKRDYNLEVLGNLPIHMLKQSQLSSLRYSFLRRWIKTKFNRNRAQAVEELQNLLQDPANKKILAKIILDLLLKGKFFKQEKIREADFLKFRLEYNAAKDRLDMAEIREVGVPEAKAAVEKIKQDFLQNYCEADVVQKYYLENHLQGKTWRPFFYAVREGNAIITLVDKIFKVDMVVYEQVSGQPLRQVFASNPAANGQHVSLLLNHKGGKISLQPLAFVSDQENLIQQLAYEDLVRVYHELRNLRDFQSKDEYLKTLYLLAEFQEAAKAELIELAEKDNYLAQLYLGKYYENNNSNDGDSCDAVIWYFKAKEKIPEAKAAFERLANKFKLSEKSEGDLLYKIGCNFFNGEDNFPKDSVRSRKCYVEALAKGNANAFNNLGFMYHNGHGGPRDYGLALVNFQNAIRARAFAAVAESNIGVLFENGSGVDKDLYKALTQYDKAIAGGYNGALERHKKLFQPMLEGILTAPNANDKLTPAEKFYEPKPGNSAKSLRGLVLILQDKYEGGLYEDKEETQSLYFFKGLHFALGIGVSANNGTADELFARAKQLARQNSHEDWEKMRTWLQGNSADPKKAVMLAIINEYGLFGCEASKEQAKILYSQISAQYPYAQYRAVYNIPVATLRSVTSAPSTSVPVSNSSGPYDCIYQAVDGVIDYLRSFVR